MTLCPNPQLSLSYCFSTACDSKDITSFLRAWHEEDSTKFIRHRDDAEIKKAATDGRIALAKATDGAIKGLAIL